MLVGDSVKAAALEENEKLRTILLSALSHDLRTPLTSITGAVTSLRELGEKLSPEDRKDLLLSIEEEAGRLSRFIANLLDMSRIESGGLSPRSDLVNVADVIRNVLERSRKTFSGKDTSISIAPDLPPIRGDANLLGQVLFNLIDNAHKYGGPTGVIIHARREGADVVINHLPEEEPDARVLTVQCDSTAWATQLRVNLVAPAELTRLLLPVLRVSQGQVVFVNSGAGLRANAGWSAYAASKHGLKALADALRLEEAQHGVRVTSIYPGRTATPMQERVHQQEGQEYDADRFITPDAGVTTILPALDLPRDAEITDLTVRPGR